VESPDEVLEALGPLAETVEFSGTVTLKHPAELQLNAQEQLVLQSVESQPTSIDSIVVATGLPVARVLSTLGVLEMRRLIRRMSGQLVYRP
ncbi:MAG TPA: DNA-protecting protein DprA, partial [Pirellulaceae bacterium]